ncbi:hypothetical protein WQ57_05465 [Mesobacillus campisalis]|uniref:DGQHR domain-containing protein n=1 Tax=Mesobacillus campisalis TaxID=1408103 RepID=A0A0M2SZU2_9BACI|nr:DGQHR domain-containing protein [Mesobacillus campisalis]KKK39211.1 hypothetical protein WQ57_05465 [Mesobacillus campisalis]
MNNEMDYELELEKDVLLTKGFIKVKQGNFDMCLISLRAEELIKYSAVHYYKNIKGNEGYQRQLVTNHYRRIAKYIESEDAPILPPAILAATEPEFMSINSNEITIRKVIRIVDGQHRIQGLRYLKENNPGEYKKIENYEFPVILMIINKGQKIHEVNTFVNINSKGKKVSTDLAILLRDRIREEEFNEKIKYLSDKEFEEAIATKIAKKLTQSKESIWYDLIKMAGGEDDKGKPISINAFNQSLNELIKFYIQASAAERTKGFIDTIVSELTPLLSSAWDIAVLKWSECFFVNKPNKHNKLFNIQKGIGVYPIHQLLGECLLLSDSDTDRALLEFKKIIKKSKVEYTEWKIGGILSSYNSKAGFKIIASYIKNEIDLYNQNIGE